MEQKYKSGFVKHEPDPQDRDLIPRRTPLRPAGGGTVKTGGGVCGI
ncbi:MAG: hypothetical protein ACLSAP_10205 [Oscillospiraceae bacterium]